MKPTTHTIKEKFQNKNGNLDTNQLFDDFDQYTEDNDIDMVKGMMTELERRVKEK